MHVNNDFAAAPSPGWGPRGQGPSKNRKGPSKNIRNDHVPPGLPDRNFGILGAFLVLKNPKKTKCQPCTCSMEAGVDG